MQNAGLSLKLVWLTVSLGILLVLAAPFALGRERAAHLAPVCEWKAKYGRTCAFCGMTTSGAPPQPGNHVSSVGVHEMEDNGLHEWDHAKAITLP